MMMMAAIGWVFTMFHARHCVHSLYGLSPLIFQKPQNSINSVLQMRKLRLGDIKYFVYSEKFKVEPRFNTRPSDFRSCS